MISYIGVEFTFDNLSIACVENGRRVLALETKITSSGMYEEFGGVVPTLNLQNGRNSVSELLKNFQYKFGYNFNDVVGVAYSAYPGFKSTIKLARSIAVQVAEIVGVDFVIPVDHLHAHFYSIYLESNLHEMDSSLFLIISGGNTKLFHFNNHRFDVVCETIDIAVGDMLDKLARRIGFKHAKEMDSFPSELKTIQLPKLRIKNCTKQSKISFSGLQTFFERWLDQNQNIFSRSEQVGCIFNGTFEFLFGNVNLGSKTDRVVISGGVSQSVHLKKFLESKNFNAILPLPCFAEDNGAMIAAAAYFMNYDITPD